MPDDFGLSCPLPARDYERIVLAHGGGGRVMQQLIRELFAREFANDDLELECDGAELQLSGPVAMSTDAFTVSPLFFPGGDIGRLAVCGTVNDVTMAGARARYLSVAFVLEEGLLLSQLQRIVHSMAETAHEAGVHIVTGDTKVVERGKGDGVFITTTGIGPRFHGMKPAPKRIRPGDAVLVSGPIGDHGMAIIAAREHLEFAEPLISDVAALAAPVEALYDAGITPHCLRDPTRGGLASAICELSAASGLEFVLEEAAIPVRPQVQDACELLGLDPLYVASEGRFVAVVAKHDLESALQVLHAQGCTQAAHIGTVKPGRGAVITTPLGGARILDMLSGEQLPRIC